MTLPIELQEIIDKLLNTTSLENLRNQSAALSATYREARSSASVNPLSYLATRFPATFACISSVFQELKQSLNIKEILDLGAGPGTGLWAAREVFHEPLTYTAVDCKKEFLDLAKQLVENQFSRSTLNWVLQNLDSPLDLPLHECVLLSFSLTEMRDDTLVRKAWEKSKKALVIIEPGTPQGYQRILQARDILFKEGAHMVAPCPHFKECPMKKGPNWCHFSVRLQRSFHHRYAKQASLPYEDEKFSYLIVSRESVPLPEARIVSTPQKHSGHVVLPLCAQQGLEKRVCSKRNKSLYQMARKSEWGDRWPTRDVVEDDDEDLD